ncbi:1-deoxy-D-xylulose-5-phosphate reductoisomerase [Thalassotalea sp. ND16A]|uniref:1-deoxy-D-xylulose-5-phosphate reductoisomerase n=1 Tax=Thalassotalea sp. ND16A TaxID=1535422 RepID=UPI00051A37C5|nr:1-deoxy-D-xylulose-5-phosphate reductoisomerase [Thalassotalea sp. ND16A]KGJ91069.1 1-deoxy-D-xylulose-5-phosphate reductoisomerase [Thalassotalea sp. ND16A]
MQNLCVLGATGSIGISTLDVVQRHRDKYNVVSLSANKSVAEMHRLCVEFMPETAVMVDEYAAEQLKLRLLKDDIHSIEVLAGKQALIELASSDNIDIVMAAIVGASGLLPTLAAVHANKKVLLANKEALVTSGQIFIDALHQSNAQLLPIDSEHNAIFQCLPGNMQTAIGRADINDSGISKILLTGSGGPFRQYPLEQFDSITPEQACAHPNWDMGRKISVDSATMMNKGLEFIEAKWLFNLDADNIQVVLHPQSTIHSMVQYKDGSVIAQMGNPDMRTPIAHALAYPERIDSGVEPFDFFKCKDFQFGQADFARYPNLKLAIDACKAGQGACTALNAANEVAVAAFLNCDILFTDISKVNEAVMMAFSDVEIVDIDAVLALDKQARNLAEQQVLTIKGKL